MAGSAGPKAGAAHEVTYRRVYEETRPGDGRRVLVDRIWPRGLRREQAGLDVWLREVAPSTQLRLWYGHDPARFAEFRARYLAELSEPQRRQAAEELRDLLALGPVTLLTASRDLPRSQAAVLAEWLTADPPQRQSVTEA